MYLFLFICTLLIPVSMIVIGFSYKKHPPQNRNGLIGYRTTMSRLNTETWNYAHKYVGTLWLILGIILTAATILIMLVVKNSKNFETHATILTFFQLGVMVLTIVPVEIRLNQAFDKNGKRKQKTRSE